ncbi:hypothetical protein [Cypionkella psychrotolerans]|uniref:hypothetical protein n=1 Tax=Cypionkella psychrotolerans TaxID=1678131 RepID=UPI000A4E1E52|nr:hypothetical protein [Cypionkella psychrotolerans]
MGITLNAVKKLVAFGDGGPWLNATAAEIVAGLAGGAYVSLTEINRFETEYATLGMIARTVGVHACAVKRLLAQRIIQPTFDPAWLGSVIYRKSDVAGFMAESGSTGEPEKFRRIRAVFRQKSADFAESDLFGESDVSHCSSGHSGPCVNQLLTFKIVLFMMVTT